MESPQLNFYFLLFYHLIFYYLILANITKFQFIASVSRFGKIKHDFVGESMTFTFNIRLTSDKIIGKGISYSGGTIPLICIIA